MENLGYLIGAYVTFWFLTAVYLATIDRRQREIRKALDKLERQKS